MESVRHYRAGYLLILLSPVISLLIFLSLFLLTPPLLGISGSFMTDVLFIGWNASVMLLLTIGIALYLHGYLRRNATNEEAETILVFSFLLIFWGAATYFVAWFIQSDLIDRSMNPRTPIFTIWDNIDYLMWELKGILWIATGIMLIITSLMLIRHKSNKNPQKTQTVVQ